VICHEQLDEMQAALGLVVTGLSHVLYFIGFTTGNSQVSTERYRYSRFQQDLRSDVKIQLQKQMKLL